MKVPWLQRITVEPSLFLYMTASFMNFPLQQQLVYSHYCDLNPDCSGKLPATLSPTTNHSHSPCGTRSDVSAQTSHFNLYLTLAAILPGSVITLALGAWSDGVGRKLVMGLPVAGAAGGAIVNILVYYLKLDIQFLILSSLISGLLGSYAMFNQASFAYAADMTSQQQRTRRLGILEAMIFLGMTVGSEVGGVWKKEQGFGPPFWGVLVSFLLVLSYVSLILQESTIADCVSTRPGGIITKQNLTRAVGLLLRPSPVQFQMVAICIALIFATLNFNGIVDVTVPYLFDEPFRWDSALLGHFLALSHFLQGISVLVVLPLLLRKGVSDLMCIQIGIISSGISLAVLALARSTVVVFFGKYFSRRGFLFPFDR